MVNLPSFKKGVESPVENSDAKGKRQILQLLDTFIEKEKLKNKVSNAEIP
ncbi:MAG: hypothetical protein WAU91_13360 [Desulfatitalea sp.]